jgi:uncharacterized LabA/DUF88 family protein
MKRISFLIDGFNVYHSILKLQKDKGHIAKWLNWYSLCSSYLHIWHPGAELSSIYYFSALAYHRIDKDSNVVKRHESYLTCLEETGVNIVLGRFKEKWVHCKNCRTSFIKHEEKETDVNIAVKLLELLFTDVCDIAVLITGDTDLYPAVKRCKELFPKKHLLFAFPYARKTKELWRLAQDSFSISGKQYLKHQFPNPFILKNGKEIFKPKDW